MSDLVACLTKRNDVKGAAIVRVMVLRRLRTAIGAAQRFGTRDLQGDVDSVLDRVMRVFLHSIANAPALLRFNRCFSTLWCRLVCLGFRFVFGFRLPFSPYLFHMPAAFALSKLGLPLLSGPIGKATCASTRLADCNPAIFGFFAPMKVRERACGPACRTSFGVHTLYYIVSANANQHRNC